MFQNEYEKDNPLQKLWESTQVGSCLCTMRESCSVCENFSAQLKQSNLVKELARSQGFQLYSTGSWPHNEPYKVNME